MTKAKAKTEVSEIPEIPECVHHWVIEPPNGPVSEGRCKRCSRVQDFHNWSPDPGSFDYGTLPWHRRKKVTNAIV